MRVSYVNIKHMLKNNKIIAKNIKIQHNKNMIKELVGFNPV